MNIYDLYAKWCEKNYHFLEEVIVFHCLLNNINKDNLTDDGQRKYKTLYNEINTILEASL